jgi:DNA-binding transcriptional LysR family regulator
MLDGVSLDQLRAFIAAADAGSFSAAARTLRRAQSVVSQTISNLEGQMGVALFDRSHRSPQLTPEGVVLLADARMITAGVDALKARAKGMAGGLEPELSVVVDVMFPMAALTGAAKAFSLKFPRTPLRLYVEALGGAIQPVLDGRCGFGIVGTLPIIPPSLAVERLSAVVLVMVAAREHPLAAISGVIPKTELARHVQLVLTDRSALSAGREFGVLSPNTWRFADLGAKHAFLLNGLGWGSMPLLAIQDDIASGRLTELVIEDAPKGGFIMPMSAVYRRGAPPGPAGRWLIDRLKQCPDAEARAAADAMRAVSVIPASA